MKLDVDKEKCIKCGACVSIAPEVFDFDDEGFAYVKKETKEIDEENIEAALEALESCPTEAIYKL
jgi:ferredoxin